MEWNMTTQRTALIALENRLFELENVVAELELEISALRNTASEENITDLIEEKLSQMTLRVDTLS